LQLQRGEMKVHIALRCLAHHNAGKLKQRGFLMVDIFDNRNIRLFSKRIWSVLQFYFTNLDASVFTYIFASDICKTSVCLESK